MDVSKDKIVEFFKPENWVAKFDADQDGYLAMLRTCKPSDIEVIKMCCAGLSEVRRMRGARELVLVAISMDVPSVKSLATALFAYCGAPDAEIQKATWTEVREALKVVIKEMSALSQVSVDVAKEKARGGPGILTRLYRWLA
jgi:hypothetical protein